MKFLMMLSFVATSAFAGEVQYSNTATFSANTAQIKLVDAEYVVVPTVIEWQQVPGCVPNAESGETCMKEVVLESVGVVRANMSYEPSLNPSTEGSQIQWHQFTLKTSDFSAGDISELKNANPRRKHPFSKIFREFAKRNLELSVVKEVMTLKVVDAKKSHFCRTRQDGTKDPSCVEKIVYKDSQKNVKRVTVLIK